MGIGASFLYMRNATRYYGAHAQIVVNDNTQEKDNSLNVSATYQDELTKLSEVEKQIEIIRSNALLADVANKIKLNIAGLIWAIINITPKLHGYVLVLR